MICCDRKLPPAFVVTVRVYELPVVMLAGLEPDMVVNDPPVRTANGDGLGAGVAAPRPNAVMTPTVFPDVSLIMMLFILAAVPPVCSR